MSVAYVPDDEAKRHYQEIFEWLKTVAL